MRIQMRPCTLLIVACLTTSLQAKAWFGVSKVSSIRGGSTTTESVAPSCCYITSQSVPKTVREQVLQELSSSSLNIVQPKDCWQAVAAADASVVLFRPDIADLQRGEGLWTMLGPIMERMLSQSDVSRRASLCIIAPSDINFVRAKMEEAAVQLIPYLSNHSEDRISTLQDVFRNVQYVKSPQEAVTASADLLKKNAASTAIATIATPKSPVVKMGGGKAPMMMTMTPANLAAARRLGVDARRQVDETMEKVRRACTGDNGRVKMVSNFGDLCKASVQQATLKGVDPTSDVAKQMQLYVKSSLEHSLADLCDQQMSLLEEACFEEFRGKLSSVKITPNLPSDMAKLADSAVSKFAKAANRIAVPGAVSPSPAFRRRLTEYLSARLLKAQATNKFRPVPRKGITVGFHWLLPKPFGNDYRQEPWNVHATDNMVYVPSALADVNPEQVAEGTWRDAIVPLPSGKDMLYMQ